MVCQLIDQQTVAFLRLHVREFVEPENWPPNSPDLNSEDYLICGALQQLVYRSRRIRDLLSPGRSTANLQLGADWSRRYRPRYTGHFLKRLSLVVATGG